jgi:hypothetical protein
VTTTFRIEHLRLDTSGGPVSYSFSSDLTVLAGPTGVGKTSLLELAKYALGGDGFLASVAEENVSLVHITIRIGTEHYQLSRSITPDRSTVVEVTDLIDGQRLADHHTDKSEPKISDLLMTALDLPTGLLAAARTSKSTRKGSRITFNDVFRFLYVPQLAINREIAGSSNTYYDPKRKTVFELLFNLTTPELINMRSNLTELNNQANVARAQVEAVERFLADSGTTSRIEAELQLTGARRDGAAASALLVELTDGMVETTDRETHALRDLLAEAEQGLTDAETLSSDLTRESVEYAAEKRRLKLDIARLDRLISAGARIANIEFSSCPRCLQSLDRDVPEGTCRVCVQDDVVGDLPVTGQYESAQLRSQLEEIDEQLTQVRLAQSQAGEATENRKRLIQRLTVQIDERTRQRVSPRLQAYADAARRAERAIVEEAALDRVLRQWDRAEDLRNDAERIERERGELEARIRAREAQDADRVAEVLRELTDEFQGTVESFGIPNGQRARINPETYLPELGGRRFDKVSSAGGIATATQVAYWMSVVAVAARRRDTKYPGFLMIDSPRLALNTAEGMASQMYRRFVAQVGTVPGRLQFIIADNELPEQYGRDFIEVVFSIERPTVPTIPHPGPANVKVVGGDD